MGLEYITPCSIYNVCMVHNTPYICYDSIRNLTRFETGAVEDGSLFLSSSASNSLCSAYSLCCGGGERGSEWRVGEEKGRGMREHGVEGE